MKMTTDNTTSDVKFEIVFYETSPNKNIIGPITHKETVTVTKGGKKRAEEWGRSIAKERGWRFIQAERV